MPIIVSRVAPNTPADNAIPRLNEGDQVLFINGRDVSQHTHEQVRHSFICSYSIIEPFVQVHRYDNVTQFHMFLFYKEPFVQVHSWGLQHCVFKLHPVSSM